MPSIIRVSAVSKVAGRVIPHGDAASGRATLLEVGTDPTTAIKARVEGYQPIAVSDEAETFSRRLMGRLKDSRGLSITPLAN
jgi:hypothetical protein